MTAAAEVVWLAELSAYDIGGASTTTLRYASHGFCTGPSETPANTEYDERVVQAAALSRHAFASRATRGAAAVSAGDLILANADGALDDLATDYGFSGRTLTIRKGTVGAAYPSGFPVYATLTMESVEVARDQVIVRVRDGRYRVDVPLQTAVYAGDNALPDGLEGTADDLKGRTKPLAFGAILNAPLPCVNTSRDIYQLNDGTVGQIDDVYDAGIRLGIYAPVDWATRSVSNIDSAKAIATDGTYIIVGGSNALSPVILSSTDGSTFNLEAQAGSAPFTNATSQVTGLAYSPTLDLWVACTDGLEIATASDPTGTWTIRSNPGGATGYWTRVRWDSMREIFVLCGTSGQIATSADGTTWTARTSGSSQTLQDVAVDGPLLVVVGNTGDVTTSADGTTWAKVAVGSGSPTRFAAIYTNGVYLIGNKNDGTALRSADGLGWTTVQVCEPGSGGRYVVGFFAVEAWIVAFTYAVGDPTQSTIAASRDGGATWLNFDESIDGTEMGCAFEDRIYAACSMSGAEVAYSGAPSAYASLADLEDDTLAPSPGTYKYISHADGSYIRLGSPPAGAVTADFRTSATVTDNTAGQVFTDILTAAGYTSSDWVTADITALDTADDAEVGLYLGVDDRRSVADALSAVADTVGAWWGPRASDGKFRVVQLTLPSGTAAATFVASDLRRPLTLVAPADEGNGVPSWRTSLRYARNWSGTQRDGIAEGTGAARRAFLAEEWRVASYEAASVQTAHLNALDTTEDTLYVTASDAVAEATRRQTIRGTLRRMFELVVALNDDTDELDRGDVVTLTHDRYGLSAGVDFRVLGVAPNPKDRELTLTVWGT